MTQQYVFNSGAPALSGRPLLASDLEQLARSGISSETAERALLRRVDSFTGAEIVGRNGSGNYAGILFPYVWPDDQHVREYRLRRDYPEMENGKPRNKYLSPPGHGNMLYFVPGTRPEWLSDRTLPILLTEGEKKCLALWELSWRAAGDAAGKPAWLTIALGGVWNWRGKTGKCPGPSGERLDEVGPIPDLDRVPCRDRRATIIFDSNVHTNENVRIARFALAKELRGRGARVLFVDIPVVSGVNGVDDLIGAWGEERVRELIATGAYDPTKKPFGSFMVNDDGIYFIKPNENETDLVKIASRIDVVGKTQDATGANCGRLLRWRDDEGRQHEWAMPMELLASDCVAVRARLLSEGLPYLATNRVLRERFSEYLQTWPVNDKYLYVERIGWHGRTYVLPDQSIGPNEAGAVRYESPPDAAHHHWIMSGTAEDWRTHIGILCTGNSRLLLAASCAFVGPVLSVFGAESGGVHLIGDSSIGKSTALKVAVSICGEPKFIQSWRNTANGLEAKAAAHNDATLFLDELAELDPREASEIAYLLANGQGKGRMSRSIAVRAQLTWRLLFVSSGEISLSEHAASAGRKTKGGIDVRLLNIPADPGCGMGLFEDLHDHASPAAFADSLCAMAERYYGATFRSFVRKLVAKRTESERAVNAVRRKFLKCVPINAVGEVKRAADRFALIAAAGELASRYELTGWEKGAALNAATRCYEDWLAQRGTTGSADLYKAVRQVRAFLEKHGSSRFQFVRGGSTAEEAVIHDRVGFRRINGSTGECEFLMLPETFKGEVCKGFSYLTVINELERLGFARCQRPAATIKTSLPGFQKDVHVFCIRPAILEGDPNADVVACCIGTVGTVGTVGTTA